MATALRPSGISIMGAMPWGTHVCLFYETTQDLLDTVVPYCKAGLEHHEFCLWILSKPLTEEEARRALRQAVPDLARHLAERSIAILPYDAWYLTEGALDLHRVIHGQEKLAQAMARGYAGMRASGTPVWRHEQGWWDVRTYEQELDKVIAQQRMLVLCTYPLAASDAADIFDVARHHQVVVARWRGQWEMVETPELKRAKEEIKQLHDELERRVMERTRQLTTAHKALQRQMAERMRAEEALWKSAMQYRSVFEFSHDVIVLLDATGQILEINRRGAHVTGYHDASCLPKRGKQTCGLGPFFNGGARRAERGLEISPLAGVDVTRRCAVTLAVAQTPPREEATQAVQEETRVDFSTPQLRAHRHRLPPSLPSHCHKSVDQNPRWTGGRLKRSDSIASCLCLERHHE